LSPSPSVLQKLAPPGFGGPGGPPGGGPGGPPGGLPPQLPLTYATWSPKGNSLVYVFANNIYYRASPSAEDVPLSNSGQISIPKNLIMYQKNEEILILSCFVS